LVFWNTAVLEDWVLSVSLHDSTIPLLPSLFFQPFELFEPLERFELILGLPATAQGSVELHHRVQLPSTRPGQCQLLVEELLVGDQNL
jgi:hypothetical protein